MDFWDCGPNIYGKYFDVPILRHSPKMYIKYIDDIYISSYFFLESPVHLTPLRHKY